MPHYEIGLACLNGHPVNAGADSSPERNAKFCPECGEPTIHQCPTCKENIRGHYAAGWAYAWYPASHCHECGTPYPWTQRRSEALAEAIDELDDLADDDRERLKKSIPDILVETPKSETAALRFKKAIAKLGTAGGRILADVLRKVAADAVKSSLGL